MHLGNLREFLTVHFVAEEIRRRGVPVRHLHSWDDYDRFRKVPAGVDPSWEEHIGRPLSGVPDPWECHASWAEHFTAPLQASLRELGVEMEEVSQTEKYRAGTYRAQILTAVDRRDGHRAGDGPLPHQGRGPRTTTAPRHRPRTPSTGAGELARFPYKPFCAECGRDTVEADGLRRRDR